jgi:hypothetical protein
MEVTYSQLLIVSKYWLNKIKKIQTHVLFSEMVKDIVMLRTQVLDQINTG